MALKWFNKKKEEDHPHESVDETAEKPVIDKKQKNITDEPVISTGGPTQPETSEISQQHSQKILENESIEETIEHHEDEKELPGNSPPPIKTEQEKKSQKHSGFLVRLKKGLSKTRKILTTDIDELFAGSRFLDDEMIEDLEELLITADIGVQTTMEITQRISKKSSKIKSPSDLKEHLKTELLTLIQPKIKEESNSRVKPHVVMVIGVNGVGKTTTIGKLASKNAAEGKKVLIAAADTFRAAAIEQLTIWANRSGAEIVKHKADADPAAVAFDGVEAAIARNKDVVFIDTAGRLHTKINLMEELKKIKRSISKKLPDAPHEVLLVLDATTGQNAVSQAKMFKEALDVSGLVLTKLDGTAKGGIVVSICNTLELPLKYVGVGETIDDLQNFDPVEFVNAIL